VCLVRACVRERLLLPDIALIRVGVDVTQCAIELAIDEHRRASKGLFVVMCDVM
jgi:hypothetical protein